MLIGKIGAYKIFNVTKKLIEKENFIKELEEVEADIKRLIVNILDNGGCAYGLGEKASLKAVYLFESGKSENKTILTFKFALHTDEVKDQVGQFEKSILAELKEKVNWGKCTKVIWNDVEIETQEVKGFPGLTLSTCILFGLVYGIIFDNLALGLAMGVAIGMCFEATVKRKKK